MFEQATLSNGPAGKRALTTVLGMTSQVAMVSLAVLAPMVWPQVLPTTRFWESLAPPVPPGPKPLGDTARKQPVRQLKPWNVVPLDRYQPTGIPRTITMMQEDPSPAAFVDGSIGDALGSRVGIVTGMLADMAKNAVHVAPPPVGKPPAPTPAATPAAIPRLPVGGRVQLGQVLRKVQPLYPPLAKSAHITGDVVLECVVGADGRMLEAKVRSGNPLLVRAAVDAVMQWAYEPSQLNSVPIEIVTVITVSFKLN